MQPVLQGGSNFRVCGRNAVIQTIPIWQNVYKYMYVGFDFDHLFRQLCPRLWLVSQILVKISHKVFSVVLQYWTDCKIWRIIRIQY